MTDTANNAKLICVVGPTASGKSSLALRLARALDGEIISCDSMQLYRGMDIGTAKTTKEEADGIPIRLTDVFDIGEPFSVTDYAALAEKAVREVVGNGHVPVFCGGTGLYIDTFVRGLSLASYENKPGEREALTEYAAVNGADALYEELLKVDPESAAHIEKGNVRRVIRALEVFRSTGVTASEMNRRAVEKATPRDALYIGLAYRDRNALYARIDARVDEMMRLGLFEETKTLVARGLRDTKTATQAIGYKEFYPYLDGTATLEECVEVLKAHTRQYAKRQLTWFKRNENVHFLYRDEMTEDEVFAAARKAAEAFLRNE